MLNQLKGEERTIIIYEAPHHLLGTLKELNEVLGNRRLAVVRELTKFYEEVLHFTLEESIEYYSQNSPKGEFVLVIQGGQEDKEDDWFGDISISDHILVYMDEGLSKKEAIKKVAVDRDLPKSQVYKHSIHIPGKNKD